MRLLKRILEMRDAPLIIFPKVFLLGLPQNSFEIGLKLIQVILCSIKMLVDNPLQAPRPFPIPVVADWIEYLALGVLKLGGDKRPGIVNIERQFFAPFMIFW